MEATLDWLRSLRRKTNTDSLLFPTQRMTCLNNYGCLYISRNKFCLGELIFFDDSVLGIINEIRTYIFGSCIGVNDQTKKPH